jgi:dienelactone hydrolase
MKLIVILAVLIVSRLSVASPEIAEYTLKFPDGKGPFPTILLLHHSGGYSRTLDQVDRYVNLGYAVAMPDYFSPFGLRSKNRFEAFKERRLEIQSALLKFTELLVKQEKVDPENIYSVGLSAGGFYSAFLACEQRVKAGIAHYGVWKLPGIKNTYSNFGAKKYPAQYFTEKCSPFLALHGTKDETQPIEYARQAFEYISKNNSNFRVHLYEGADHAWDKGDVIFDPKSVASDSLRRTHSYIQSFIDPKKHEY